MSNGHNFIAFACGMKRSGKSYLLGQFASRFPRRLVFDFLAEFQGGRIAGAREAWTLGECVDALRAARSSGNRWTVVATLDERREIPELLSVIIPSGGNTARGFSRAVGGMVIECGEIDLIAPNNGSIAPEVRSMFQRGRHHALSVLAATQRPRDTHRVVTSQSDVICAFRQHEPRDAEYLGSVMRSDAVELLQQLRPRHYLRYWPNFGKLELVDPTGVVQQPGANVL